MDVNQISGIIIDAAMKVHTVLGPGLLEHAYQACLKHELLSRELKAFGEVGMPINFGEQHLKNGIVRIINSPSARL